MRTLDKDLLSVQEVRDKIAEAKRAQGKLKEYSQEQIDRIVYAISVAGQENSERLAKMAKEETGYGKWKDKLIKNIFASKFVYDSIKDMKTVGIIREDKESKVFDVAVPVGVIAALIPSTNPTSTVIFKALVALKAGNAVVFSPHPSAKNCIQEAARICADTAVKSGAPEGIITCLDTLSGPGTKELLGHRDVSLILATGGEAMVRAAYSSGTPAIGVGPGNAPVFIERTADIPKAVGHIIDSKTFDNGVICASEQAIVVEHCSKEAVTSELRRRGAYFMDAAESELVGSLLLLPNKATNPAVVGKSAAEVASMVGIDVPEDTPLLISEQSSVSYNNPYSREKLTPVLALYTETDWESACERCLELLANEGLGHTLIIHSKDERVIREFGLKKTVSRVLVNTPGALGGVGATANLQPSFTLGCGAVGGGSTSDNVGPLHLFNVRRVAYGVRELSDLTGGGNSNTGTGSANFEQMVSKILQMFKN